MAPHTFEDSLKEVQELQAARDSEHECCRDQKAKNPHPVGEFEFCGVTPGESLRVTLAHNREWGVLFQVYTDDGDGIEFQAEVDLPAKAVRVLAAMLVAHLESTE